jgi:hypothetical protein
MPKKHTMPPFLEGKTSAEAYERWLDRKAIAHVKRDRARGRDGDNVSRPLYKEAIHAAVLLSNGRDCYTGELLEWHLISKYDNDSSKAGRHQYKAKFALLPSVDHLDAGASEASFRICAWRTNDAKNDLTVEAFVDLCKRVVAFAERSADTAK